MGSGGAPPAGKPDRGSGPAVRRAAGRRGGHAGVSGRSGGTALCRPADGTAAGRTGPGRAGRPHRPGPRTGPGGAAGRGGRGAMRFGTLYIDGFGMHRNRTFELDPRAPLVLFTGRNEAGKSTVMGFIRAMLFGFPTRARPAERYEPFGGGPHGGWLTLIDGRIGEIRLERYDGKGYPILHFPDGTQGGEAELAALLAGLTPDLYRNLFAFSLSELARLETLQGDEISGFLYGSGAGVSGSAVVQAEKRLAAAMDELYKRQGRKQPIHEKLRELEKLEAELRRSR